MKDKNELIQFTVLIPAALKKEFKQRCRENGTLLSYQIKELMTQYVEGGKK